MFCVVGDITICLFVTLWAAWHCVRVVKESDLNSDGLCPHRFEPCRCRTFFICDP